MRLLPVLAVALLPVVAAAQDAPPAPISGRQPACRPTEPCRTQGPLAWDSTNVVPRHPAAMLAVGIDGVAEVDFAVRPDGTVDGSTVKVTRSTNRAFEASAQAVVPTWRFRGVVDTTAALQTRVIVHFLIAQHCGSQPTVTTAFTGWEGVARLVVMTCPVLRVPRGH
jgi:TonB family protein